MEYSSTKDSEGKKLSDVAAEIEGIEPGTGEVQGQKQIPDTGGEPSNFSESEIEEKLGETEKKKVVLKLSRARELLTEKRREMLQTLSRKDFNSITELAEELGRDKKNTSQDIKKLYQNGVIDLEDRGRSKKPVFNFEKIEIEGLEFKENRERPEEH